MLRGTQTNFIGLYTSCTAYQQATQVALQSSAHVARNAATLELADRLVGHITEELFQCLGVETAVRRVLISAETQRHAIAQRKISNEIDSELVAQRIAEAFAKVHYLLMPQQQDQMFRLVGYAESASRWLVLPLKFISSQQSRSREDEFWIRTAFPFGQKKMRRAQAKGLLLSLEQR